MEEAVLRDPYNHLLQIRLAELYYTLGACIALSLFRPLSAPLTRTTSRGSEELRQG